MSSTSQYLAAKTATLQSQTPVDPAQARAAQIPLHDFNLPTFPPEAFRAGLTTLILTSDINPDSYATLLARPFSIPDLPPSIKSLNLELFALGYPPGFLTELGKKLPSLKSLIVYSQLFAGTTLASNDDAIAFIAGQTALEEVHLLDVFFSPGILTSLSSSFHPSLKFLEMNYAYRHSNPQFLASLPSKECAALIKKVGKGLVGLTMSISAPDIVMDDKNDREGTEVGILPVRGQDARVAAEILGRGGGEWVLCDVTMFELTIQELDKILNANQQLKVLGVTVRLDGERLWDEILGVVGKEERGLEVLEIVGVPGDEVVERIKRDDDKRLLEEEMLESLDGNCKGLMTVKVSILRTRTEEWIREMVGWRKKT